MFLSKFADSFHYERMLDFILCKLCLWASLVAQVIKNLPAMQETWVQSLGWEYPLEKEMATHSSTLAGESLGQRSLAGCTVHGVATVRHNLATKLPNYALIILFKKKQTQQVKASLMVRHWVLSSDREQARQFVPFTSIHQYPHSLSFHETKNEKIMGKKINK